MSYCIVDFCLKFLCNGDSVEQDVFTILVYDFIYLKSHDIPPLKSEHHKFISLDVFSILIQFSKTMFIFLVNWMW